MRKMRTTDKVTPPTLTNLIAKQIMCDFPELNATEEVSARKWQELTNDVNFGPELQYICQRAFHCKPYTTTFVGGISLASRGWHKCLMNPQTLKLSVKVSLADDDAIKLMPVCISNLKNLNLCLPNTAYLRQWWRIGQRVGAESFHHLKVIIDGGSHHSTISYCDGFGIWSELATTHRDDDINENLEFRSTTAAIISMLKDNISDGNILVKVVGRFSHEDNKILITVLKPPKR